MNLARAYFVMAMFSNTLYEWIWPRATAKMA